MYPEILTTIKNNITQIISQLKLNINHKLHPQGRPLKIQNEDALVLALYQHRSTRATKISLYEDFKKTLKCSYKTLVVAMNRMGVWAMKILFIIMRLGKKYSHLVKYTDATDLPACLPKNAYKHKTMKHLADWGNSGKGWYYGLKMTMTRDYKGNILGLKFTSPKANDRDIFREINKDLYGIIAADAGYVSKELEKDMSDGIKRLLIIKPYKNMKKIATDWQLKIYNSRFRIEFDFRSLKLFHGLVTSLPRSINGYIANYLHALLSFVIA